MTKHSETVKKVKIQPSAFVTIVAHAAQKKNEEVHGILLGSSLNREITVKEAVAVSHGTPSKTLVETALGLISHSSGHAVVGWYNAPALLEDKKPSPVALRITSSLANSDTEPTLILVNNMALTKCFNGEGKADAILAALGEDFASQYLEPLPTALWNAEKAADAARVAYEENHILTDLVDHFDGDISSPWYPNEELTKLVEKTCS